MTPSLTNMSVYTPSPSLSPTPRPTDEVPVMGAVTPPSEAEGGADAGAPDEPDPRPHSPPHHSGSRAHSVVDLVSQSLEPDWTHSPPRLAARMPARVLPRPCAAVAAASSPRWVPSPPVSPPSESGSSRPPSRAASEAAPSSAPSSMLAARDEEALPSSWGYAAPSHGPLTADVAIPYARYAWTTVRRVEEVTQGRSPTQYYDMIAEEKKCDSDAVAAIWVKSIYKVNNETLGGAKTRAEARDAAAAQAKATHEPHVEPAAPVAVDALRIVSECQHAAAAAVDMRLGGRVVTLVGDVPWASEASDSALALEAEASQRRVHVVYLHVAGERFVRRCQSRDPARMQAILDRLLSHAAPREAHELVYVSRAQLCSPASPLRLASFAARPRTVAVPPLTPLTTTAACTRAPSSAAPPRADAAGSTSAAAPPVSMESPYLTPRTAAVVRAPAAGSVPGCIVAVDMRRARSDGTLPRVTLLTGDVPWVQPREQATRAPRAYYAFYLIEGASTPQRHDTDDWRFMHRCVSRLLSHTAPHSAYHLTYSGAPHEAYRHTYSVAPHTSDPLAHRPTGDEAGAPLRLLAIRAYRMRVDAPRVSMVSPIMPDLVL